MNAQHCASAHLAQLAQTAKVYREKRSPIKTTKRIKSYRNVSNRTPSYRNVLKRISPKKNSVTLYRDKEKISKIAL